MYQSILDKRKSKEEVKLLKNRLNRLKFEEDRALRKI